MKQFVYYRLLILQVLQADRVTLVKFSGSGTAQAG
jgi:hypothetical protein